MAINKFIPGVTKITDHRGNPTGYYEAVCDVCGTPYYPRRSNSKYCNSKCAVVAHRKSVAEGKVIKGLLTKAKKDKEISKKPAKSIRGNRSVYLFLKNKYHTRGDKFYILQSIHELKIGASFKYMSSTIKKISAAKYEVF